MDFRGTKVFHFVSASRNLTEYARKTKKIQIQWLHDYEWLCDKYRKLEKELNKLCEEKSDQEGGSSLDDEQFVDKRSCLPFPRTTNKNYGWLAGKPDFQLEKYGNFIVKYPNPLDGIVLVTGDIPNLGCGKGFF